jgi:hypothetical protein
MVALRHQECGRWRAARKVALFHWRPPSYVMRIHVFCRSLLHELPSGCELVNGFCTEVTLRPAASIRIAGPPESLRRGAGRRARGALQGRRNNAAAGGRGQASHRVYFGMHVGKVFYGNRLPPCGVHTPLPRVNTQAPSAWDYRAPRQWRCYHRQIARLSSLD